MKQFVRAIAADASHLITVQMLAEDERFNCSRREACKALGGATLLAASGAALAGPRAWRLALNNVRLLPSPFEAPVENASILIEGDRISRILPGVLMQPAPGLHVIDGGGCVVTAGFWNSHVHLVTPLLLRSRDAASLAVDNELQRAFTRWGFTTVVDLASTMQAAGDLARRIESGLVRGPRILSAGDPFYPPNATPIYARPFYEKMGLPSAEVFSASAAAARAIGQVRGGARALKIFTGSILGGPEEVAYMPADIIQAIVRVGREHHVPVFAHPTDRNGLEIAVQNGVQVLAHATPLMGRWWPEYAAWIAQQAVAMVPTLSLFEIAPHPSTPVDVAVGQARQLDAAGGRILFGTDAGFTEEFDTEREVRLLASAVGWQKVLASLTTTPAELFGEQKDRGRVEPGYKADLVLLRGDPATDVANLSRVKLVVRDGEVIYRDPN